MTKIQLFDVLSPNLSNHCPSLPRVSINQGVIYKRRVLTHSDHGVIFMRQGVKDRSLYLDLVGNPRLFIRLTALAQGNVTNHQRLCRTS